LPTPETQRGDSSSSAEQPCARSGLKLFHPKNSSSMATQKRMIGALTRIAALPMRVAMGD
jgi:hypothetical protein